ncbi:hypothetical protein IF2G_02232 [Cordyceps javanica]|nr:hypothetical protein IF2G_02232 [Cordyceps javanica]
MNGRDGWMTRLLTGLLAQNHHPHQAASSAIRNSRPCPMTRYIHEGGWSSLSVPNRRGTGRERGLQNGQEEARLRMKRESEHSKAPEHIEKTERERERCGMVDIKPATCRVSHHDELCGFGLAWLGLACRFVSSHHQQYRNDWQTGLQHNTAQQHFLLHSTVLHRPFENRTMGIVICVYRYLLFIIVNFKKIWQTTHDSSTKASAETKRAVQDFLMLSSSASLSLSLVPSPV